MNSVQLDSAALAVYENRCDDCTIFYDYLDDPRSCEAILFALEWRELNPPLHVLEVLWPMMRRRNPFPFFVVPVFDKVQLWERIIRDLVDDGNWAALACHRATHARAVFGHLACSSLYCQALYDSPAVGLRLCTCYVSPLSLSRRDMRQLGTLLPAHTVDVVAWLERMPVSQLVHVSAELLTLPGVDYLLEKMVRHPVFRAAVAKQRGLSTVCLLTLPLSQLSDEELGVMINVYLPRRSRLQLGQCLEWHTERLRRGLPTREIGYGPPPVPRTVHEQLYWIRFYHEHAPYNPYLLAKALREQPDACANLRGHYRGRSIHDEVARHRAQMVCDVQLVGRWPLPRDVVTYIASFVG